MRPTTADAYKLVHDGALALARVEQTGMRIDTVRLETTISEVAGRITRLTERLKRDEVWRAWRRRFGDGAKLGSRQQLGVVLFEEIGCRPQSTTPTGRAQVNEAVLKGIDLPFVRDYLRLAKLEKLQSTYLAGVAREVVDGYLHPSFNLHLVRTYRSSSDSPNFHNIPTRDPEVGEAIRSCFVAREGRQLVEIDYKAVEVRVAACYHRDPAMLAYVADPARDLHRDMAAECYMLPVDAVTKELRAVAKGNFVFAQFYGDYHVHCAEGLWKAAGADVKRHLAAEGLGSLAKFTRHIERVEGKFWGSRFPVYDRWRGDWWERYQRRGWFRMLTGFRVEGVYKRNDVINYPIQGAAFHCLLWSLIRLVRWLRRNRMRTVVVGQIHDSILADVREDELDDYVAKAREVMTEDVRREWPWLITPLAVSVEATSVGGSWWDKKKVSR